MEHPIIKQSDGKYAIWSNRIDDFVHKDCTEEELIAELVKEIITETKETLEWLNKVGTKLCPDCNNPLVSTLGGLIKCTNKSCGYWEYL